MTTTTNVGKAKIGLFSIIFAISYIIAELTFNLGLVDFLNSPNTEIDTFNTLEMFGRFLSSIGFAGVIIGILMLAAKGIGQNKIAISVIFAISTIFSYGAQTAIFNKIINDMTPEQKLSAYAFGVYRNLNLNNQVTLKVLTGENKNYDMVLNSMLGVFTTVPEVENNIKETVQKFFHAENNVDQETLGKIYDELNVSLPNLDDYWGIYVIESRRYENYQGFSKAKEIYRNRFIEKIGVPPSLSRGEFESHLKNQIPSIQKAKELVIIPSNADINLKELRVKDIPENLSRKDWSAFVNNHINAAIESVKFTEKNISQLPHSENIISSVVITPIAVILSMIALFLNIVMLVAKFTKIGSLIVLGAIIGVASSWTYNPHNLNPIINRFAGLETYLVQVAKPYMYIIHNIAIDDDNPNQYKIVRIEKPKMPDMSNLKDELDSKFKNISSVNGDELTSSNPGMKAMEKITQEITVDKDNLNNSNYFGELKKDNPYLK